MYCDSQRLRFVYIKYSRHHLQLNIEDLVVNGRPRVHFVNVMSLKTVMVMVMVKDHQKFSHSREECP